MVAPQANRVIRPRSLDGGEKAAPQVLRESRGQGEVGCDMRAASLIAQDNGNARCVAPTRCLNPRNHSPPGKPIKPFSVCMRVVYVLQFFYNVHLRAFCVSMTMRKRNKERYVVLAKVGRRTGAGGSVEEHHRFKNSSRRASRGCERFDWGG